MKQFKINSNLIKSTVFKNNGPKGTKTSGRSLFNLFGSNVIRKLFLYLCHIWQTCHLTPQKMLRDQSVPRSIERSFMFMFGEGYIKYIFKVYIYIHFELNTYLKYTFTFNFTHISSLLGRRVPNSLILASMKSLRAFSTEM